MLYINNGSTISYEPKKDISNRIDTILTLPTNDANTKMVYAKRRDTYGTLNVSSPYTTYNHNTDAGPWADNYHRTINPNRNGTWGVAGEYTYPSHPGWLVAREGVLYIDDNYVIKQMSVDSLPFTFGSNANPGLYSGNYWLFNAGASWDASRSQLIAAWSMNGGGTLLNTPIYDVGYGQSHISPSTGPSPITFTISKKPTPYNPAYPLSTVDSLGVRNGTTTYSGSWSATDPNSCNWALEYIWIPLSASVGGEQTWGGYDFKDLTTPGYRFRADGGGPTTGYTASGIFAATGYTTIGTTGSGLRNAMAWRLLWQPAWSDTRACKTYAQYSWSNSRTNTDGSQFRGRYTGSGNTGWSLDIGSDNFPDSNIHGDVGQES